MGERTKTVDIYEFYYPDHRPDSQSAFVANGLIVDHEAGDVIDIDHSKPTYRLKTGKGRVTVVPAGWLWMEQYQAHVKVKDQGK